MEKGSLQERAEEKLDFQIRISVRDLVEFVLSSGDIDNRRTAGAKKEAMQEGSRLHRKIQKAMGAGYQAEVTLSHVVREECFSILVEGRADGIITEPGGCVIDEIKCVYMDISRLEEPVGVHMAQAMCYGFFWCEKMSLDGVGVQLTYCSMETEELRRFRKEYSYEELKEWFAGLIHEYMKWAEYRYRHELRRQASLKALSFPFPYRKGQKELAVNVYRAIARGRNLYIQAPTGIGKTLSVIFPSLKAMGEGMGDKLFYLTAKTVTRRVAEEAFAILRKQGMFFSSVTITAKEKLCFLEKPSCNPEDCPYAKGHYDRVNDGVFAIINQESAITREKVLAYAQEHRLCPFEFCLDISSWVDGIICDYNYVFDPNVRLKRYFAEGTKGEYLFLVDEAHNLVSRGREMYSGHLVKEDVLLAARLVKSRSPRLARLLNACNKTLLGLKRECETYTVLENVDFLLYQVREMFAVLEEFMEDNPEFEDRDLVLDFYFQVRDFLNTADFMDEGYEIYSQLREDGTFAVNLFCIDPSGRLRACMDQGISTILFSATLLPMPYYKELLSGEPEGYAIYAQSPFPEEKRLLLVGRDVSSRYSRRNIREYQKAAAYVREIVGARPGNYMVFCPSYPYLEQIETILREELDPEQVKLLVQESHMDEAAREEFLEEFHRNARELQGARDGQSVRDGQGAQKGQSVQDGQDAQKGQKKKSLAALCVIGGIFGEGIDLKEESLIGVIIIGTGLPMVCPQQDILRRYFERKGKPGFAYAYQYPGMNKVMQAAGRVIRTVKDEGVIALLDDRFLNPDYLALFPREWGDYCPVTLAEAREKAAAFWAERDRRRSEPEAVEK